MKSEPSRRRPKRDGGRSGLSAADGSTISGAAVEQRAPFVVSAVDLLRRPGHRRQLELRGSIGELTSAGTVVAAADEVELTVGLEAIPEGVVADGHLSAPWHAECRRCLTAVTGSVDVSFHELFERQPREGETYPLGHDEIDLDPLIREALLLALPLAPLCEAGCRGMCPTCGADLNEGPCGCPPAGRDPRWAALDNLRLS